MLEKSKKKTATRKNVCGHDEWGARRDVTAQSTSVSEFDEEVSFNSDAEPEAAGSVVAEAAATAAAAAALAPAADGAVDAGGSASGGGTHPVLCCLKCFF